MDMNRRSFSFFAGATTLSFLVGGLSVNLTPAEAKAKDISFQILNESEAALIDLLAEAIVPGARDAGLSHYIDHQLSSEPENTLLILRYLGMAPPFNGFYLSSIKAFLAAIKQKYHKDPKSLSKQEMVDFITVMMQKNPEGWEENAPPAPFFYFVLRSDAIDVTYGSMAGFEKLEIPYMAHIEPKHVWELPS